MAVARLMTGFVKEVVSGDTIVICKDVKDGPPLERKITLDYIITPKFSSRNRNREEGGKEEEPYAWEAREFLRKKLVGKDVSFTVTPPRSSTNENSSPSSREYGNVFFPTPENSIIDELVENGLAVVKGENQKQPNPEIQRLQELEKKAKQEGKGKWAPDAKKTGRTVIPITDKLDVFEKTHGKKPIDAIVEAVLKGGSTLKLLLLPDFYEITLLISGIRCDGADEDLQREAKYYVERRLLQRDVKVIIECQFNNNLCGSVIHPKGSIAECLLKDGYAFCVDRSILTVTNGAEKLRAAERFAKEHKLKRWKYWEPSGPKISQKDFQGTVCEIISGEGMIVKTSSGELKRIFLSSIKQPRPENPRKDFDEPLDGKPAASKPRPLMFDIPWLFEAREFLRKKLIGKKVNVTVDYIQPERENFKEKYCCTVLYNGSNVAEEMVSKGLATVVQHRQDDDNRSSCYDALLVAQQKALEGLKGLHNKKENPAHRVHDLTANLARVKGLVPLLQRQSRLEALVEYVASGARMRLFLPRDEHIITFLLSGIDCPRAGVPARNGVGFQIEPQLCGQEALNFTKERVMHRDVEIKIESHDKAGNIIGWMFVNNINLSIALVEEGLARVHGPSAERSEYYRKLVQAEEAAKQQKLNLWQHVQEEKKVETQDESVDRKVEYKDARIEVITPEFHVFAQFVTDEKALMALQDDLRQNMSSYTPKNDYRPRKGELCAAKFLDGEWYRAKVQKLMGPRAQILYVDYGNTAEVSDKDLAPLPFGLNSQKPFAHEYGLAFIKPPPNDYLDEAILKFHELISGRELSINVEYQDQGLGYITIIDTETKEDKIKKGLSLGCFLVVKRKEKKFQSLLKDYEDAQNEAKKNHELIWEFGDITEDDAKEFGFGK